jgi:phage-related minor tail protein
MADNLDEAAHTLDATLGSVQIRTEALTASSNTFSTAMARAFSQAIAGGRQLDDVLKGLALRISSLAVSQAFKPLTSGFGSGLSGLFSGLFGGGGGGSGANAKLFATGGVIGTPSYFPLVNGGLGLAGEAGPEAIMPLARGADGRLGVATQSGGAPTNITVQVSTPDLGSFRRSEAYLTGAIARAVARGQRSL